MNTRIFATASAVAALLFIPARSANDTADTSRDTTVMGDTSRKAPLEKDKEKDKRDTLNGAEKDYENGKTWHNGDTADTAGLSENEQAPLEEDGFTADTMKMDLYEPAPWHSEDFAKAADSLKTIRGMIESIEDAGPWGQVVMLDTGNDTLQVYTAPEDYLSEAGIILAPDQKIEITGAFLRTTEGEEAVIAWEITDLRNSLELRDENGEPIWEKAKEETAPTS